MQNGGCMNAKKFASRVRELRTARDLSQHQLALKLGVSRQTIFLVESGKSLPSLPLTLRMASLFNQTLDNLMNNPTPAFRGLRDLHEEIDRFFDDAFGRLPMPTALPSIGIPAINVRQDEENIYIDAAVPGFSADEIETEITDDYLTIRGEKKKELEEKDKNFMRREFAYGRFQRTIGLPDGIVADKADSTLKDGTLTITLPKSEEAKPKVKKLKPKAA